VSYTIGRFGTWLAWRVMPETRAAIADNLRVLFPDESERALERRARTTLGAYAADVIDFIRALRTSDANLQTLFSYTPADAQLFVDLQAQGRGIILVSGHYGNWEAGGVFLRRIVKQPVAIVAMTEANPEVNRLRREIRDLIGAETIEVGQSLDTALQIRRRLADNTIVPILMDRHLGRDRVDVESWMTFWLAELREGAVAPLRVASLVDFFNRDRKSDPGDWGDINHAAFAVGRDYLLTADRNFYESLLKARVQSGVTMATPKFINRAAAEIVAEIRSVMGW